MRNRKLIVLFAAIMVPVLIIIIFSAAFIVRHVDAYSYYANDNAAEYNAAVISAAGVKKNGSIFFIDEDEIKTRVENRYPNIGVVNVRRSFPDRVTVNYVIYEKSFQYTYGGKYYQCYSSGRIGSVSDAPMLGFFAIKPKNNVASTVGAYFQSESGSDRATVKALIKFMYAKGLSDFQIVERVKFVDFTRDGYVYIRMNEGCSIELKGSIAEFGELMERGFAIYKSPQAEKSSGLIKVWFNRADQSKRVASSYVAVGGEYDGKPYSDEGYYAEYYSSGAH